MSALTGLQKIALTTLVVVLAGGAVFFFQSQAGTTVGLVSVEPGFVCGTSTVLDADANVYDTVQIGQQCWMKQNMRVGMRVNIGNGDTQINNGTIEKWCYGDSDAGCTYVQSTTSPAHTYPDGGLYTWNEAMQYSTTPGAQGICPSGWHIPTHDEYTTMERAVCTTGSCATDFPYDTTTTGYRGTTEGTKLKATGSSGFEGNLAGAGSGVSFYDRGMYGDWWSSSENGDYAWCRFLDSEIAQVFRGRDVKTGGFSVRCLKDTPTTSISGTITTNPDLERGLVGHWTFDGQDVDWSSTTAEIRDRSGNGNHGNADGLVAFSTQSAIEGVLGQALHFGGNEQRINIASTTVTRPTNAITLAAWVKAGDLVLWDGIIGNTNSPWESGYGLYYSNDNRLNFFVADWAANTVYVPFGPSQFGTWHHVVGTWDGTTLRIYLDGVAGGVTDTYTGSISYDSTTYIGAIDNPIYEWDGALDDVRIYNRALSADEVKRLYQLGATTKIAETITSNPTLETGLVGHWTFDGNDVDWSSTTAEVRDRSGNANHGNALGGMSAQSAMEGRVGQAMSFDGTDNSISTNLLINQSLGASSYTFATWVKPSNSCPGWCQIVGTDSGDYEWAIFLGNGEWLAYTGGGAELVGTASVGAWQHVAVVYDIPVDTMYTYLNGVRTDGFNFSTTSANHVIFMAGASPGTSLNFPGDMDDTRIYNRALSADEVKRLYELGR